MTTAYESTISPLAPGYDPRHIEAFMRIEHGTLDHLTPARFAADVRIACACVDDGGPDFAESIAQSYGY